MLASIAKDVPLRALEAGLLSLQNRREHHSQGTTLFLQLSESGPGLFKQKMIEGLYRQKYGGRTGCEEPTTYLVGAIEHWFLT